MIVYVLITISTFTFHKFSTKYVHKYQCKPSYLLLENLQRVFTRKIPEVSHMNYWERLAHLKMYSQERRLERYRALYVWKIIEGLSPNCGLNTSWSERRGRL